MPFTLAHPAAIIPISHLNRRLSLSALLIGSVIPDVGYFLQLPTVIASHSLLGMFVVDLPISLILLWIFHTWLKRPLWRLLPAFHRERLQPYLAPYQFVPWSRFSLVILSLLIGIFAHIVWDEMTHGRGFFVQTFPIFRAEMFELAGVYLIVYFVFKHFSSIAGVGLLVYWYWCWSYQSQNTFNIFSYANIIAASLILISSFIGAIILAIGSTKFGYKELADLIRIGLVIGIGLIGSYILITKFVTLIFSSTK